MAGLRWCAVLISVGVAAAGEISFADFASTKELALVGDAGRSKKVLRLTSSAKFEAGAAWYRERQPVAAGFDTTFSFRLTDQDGPLHGADGLAFVIQNQGQKALGGVGASAGFLRNDVGAPGGRASPIVKRLAVFFDTYANAWDQSGNYMAICINGPAPDLGWPPRCQSYTQRLPADLKDGREHTVRIQFDPPRLAIYLDDLGTPLRVAAVDLASIVGGDGSAWVGFTASTGGGYENHDILRWTFAPLPESVTSTMSTVDSGISYLPVACMPNRQLCTPEEAVVEEKSPGAYHVYLPANLEWGASIPNPNGLVAHVTHALGTVCWDPRLRTARGCNGPGGNGIVPGKDAEGGPDFIAPMSAAGALVGRNLNGRTWFSINDRTGAGFADNEGFFQFDVELLPR